jgi:hypothetical protein
LPHTAEGSEPDSHKQANRQMGNKATVERGHRSAPNRAGRQDGQHEEGLERSTSVESG